MDMFNFEDIDGIDDMSKINGLGLRTNIQDTQVESKLSQFDDSWYLRMYDFFVSKFATIKNKVCGMYLFICKYFDGEFDPDLTDDEVAHVQAHAKKFWSAKKQARLDDHEYTLWDHFSAVFITMLFVILILTLYTIKLGDESIIIWAIKLILNN